MKITIAPFAEPYREIDVTQGLVAAIAEEIWRACGGNDALNWLEAERHLARIIGEARETARAAHVAEVIERAERACPGCPRGRARSGGRSSSRLDTRLLAAARTSSDDMAGQ
jgi:hypothetical protein